jgi:hypothetical protein
VRHLILLATFVFTLAIRVWGIDRRFWLLGDQTRDWSIALGGFFDLPLVGPPTHFSGYTIGPAFYWILWLIRVTVGPFFDDLPHGGGIGQAMLQSGADVVLVAAVWHRTRSIWIALTAVVLIATAAYDLCLAPLVWNPVVGSTLAKLATALVLLEWPRRSALAVGLTAAIAWGAVHAYTGAIFVAVAVFVALLVDPLVRRARQEARRNALIIVMVVAALQVPYLVHQFRSGFGDSAMGAVTGSVGEILSGRAASRFAGSLTGYLSAVNFIQGAPFQLPWSGWVLAACGLAVALRYRRDPALLTVILLPQTLAVIGYGLFLGDLDHYYYLSLMPAAVLTVLLGLTAIPWPRVALVLSVVLLIGSLAIVEKRLAYAAALHRMPEYGPLLDGSRILARRGQPLRGIHTEFDLHPSTDPAYLYRILGGRIDPGAGADAIIKRDGSVDYRSVANR